METLEIKSINELNYSICAWILRNRAYHVSIHCLSEKIIGSLEIYMTEIGIPWDVKESGTAGIRFYQDYSNLEVLLRTDYSAVVLDMMMPFDEDFFTEVKTSEKFPELSTGKYLFDEIRKRNVNIPIIFFTAFRGKIECDSRSIIISKPNLAVNVAKTIDGFITRLEKMDIL